MSEEVEWTVRFMSCLMTRTNPRSRAPSVIQLLVLSMIHANPLVMTQNLPLSNTVSSGSSYIAFCGFDAHRPLR